MRKIFSLLGNINILCLLIIAFTALSLTAAILIEYGYDLAPCQSCLNQRVAHFTALILAILAYKKIFSQRLFLGLALLTLFLGSLLAFDQYGTEMRWWDATISCMTDPTLSSVDQFEKDLLGNTKKPCDVKGDTIFGLTLSGLNGVSSFFIVLTCLSSLIFYKRKS